MAGKTAAAAPTTTADTKPKGNTEALAAARAKRSEEAAQRKAAKQAEKDKVKAAEQAETDKLISKCDPLIAKLVKESKVENADALTKSAKIRYLSSAGIKTGVIGKYLGMKFGDVYSILWSSKNREKKAAAAGK